MSSSMSYCIQVSRQRKPRAYSKVWKNWKNPAQRVRWHTGVSTPPAMPSSGVAREGVADGPQRAGLDVGVRVERDDDLARRHPPALVERIGLARVRLAQHAQRGPAWGRPTVARAQGLEFERELRPSASGTSRRSSRRRAR